MSDSGRPTPPSAVSKLGILRRLATAPLDHGEALLNGFAVLEEAQRSGVFDALRGILGADREIAGQLAQFASDPEAASALRNLLALAKVVASLDPERIAGLSKDVAEAVESSRAEEPPSVWQLLKRIQQPEARRGLALLTSVLSALGRTAK
jgi:uncharacterized protein YjgD (DUF1641 family)